MDSIRAFHVFVILSKIQEYNSKILKSQDIVIFLIHNDVLCFIVRSMRSILFLFLFDHKKIF